MLHKLSGQDLVSQNMIQQNSNVEKLAAKNNNPYSNIDKNLLIDETNISNEAINLYQRDLDIRKFASLALSDPENLSHNTLVAQKVFGANDENFENKIIEGIFNNRTFLRDLFG